MTLVSRIGNVRWLVVCMAALAVSLPIAWISLSKLLMVLVFLAEVARRTWVREPDSPLQSLQVAHLIPWVLAGTFVSLLWTHADLETAAQSLAKHSKLIFMLIPVLLLRTQKETHRALQVFAVGQIFVMLSAWLVAAGVPVPWAHTSGGRNAIFSSYLDQSIICATSAAIFWHLRETGVWPKALAILCAISAVANALLLLDGRTAYVVMVALVGLAVVWICPTRLRVPMYGVVAALMLACVAWAYVHAQHTPERNSATLPTDRVYKEPGQRLSSDAWRLNAWQLSLRAIQAAPVLGTGTGSWKAAIQPYSGELFVTDFGTSPISNPHQEFLLWGVEFGLVGMAALAFIFVLAARDATSFDTRTRNALWSVLAACVISCMFNSALYDDLIGDFLCISTGLLLALGVRSPLHRTGTK